MWNLRLGIEYFILMQLILGVLLYKGISFFNDYSKTIASLLQIKTRYQIKKISLLPIIHLISHKKKKVPKNILENKAFFAIEHFLNCCPFLWY